MLKKAFTLIEMIIVIGIITVITLMAVPSVTRMMDSAEQVRRTETAKVIYLTAQNQLTQLRALGHLKNAYDADISGDYFIKNAEGEYTDEIIATEININNVYNALGELNYPAADNLNGTAGYVRYLSKPAGLLEDHPLHLLLKPAIVDEKILEGTILIEYNVLTGKVLSVFYSDLEDVSEFNYANDNSSSDVYGQRAELYNDTADDRNQGYYGVDYTGSNAPETKVEMAIHLYDGYDDEHDDTLILPELNRYNKPIDSVNGRNDGSTLENVLYAEILIEKSQLSAPVTFNLSVSALSGVVVEDIDFSQFTNTNENFEDTIKLVEDGTRSAFIYRNDDITGSGDFARFIWVLDYVGGDMSHENADRNKYSIANITDIDGNVIDFDGLTGISVSIIESENADALEFTSNIKNPLFADNTDTSSPDPLLANIATARHLSNIRHQTLFADETYVYTQIEDIDFASENGNIKIDNAFAENEGGTQIGDTDWNLKMSPLPELHGRYTALYTTNESGTQQTGVHTISNMFIYDVNKDTDNTSDPAVINHSVGLFEKIASTGMISHLTFIEPYLEIRNTDSYYPGPVPDDGKYAGVVAGYSNGAIRHITVISNSETAPIYDLDDGTNGDSDYTNITNDYVGGIVGMVGDSIAENSISNILYLAVSPSEEMGSSGDRTRYDYPIIGTNLKNGLTTAYNDADRLNLQQSGIDGPVHKAIDDESCYYLIGEQLRPYNQDPDENPATPAPAHANLNVGSVTNGFGQGISTNDLYADLKDVNSDFYKNFMLAGDGVTLQYTYSTTVIDPLDTSTVKRTQYPYPYFGDLIPNYDSIDKTDPNSDVNFVWPIAELEAFKADYIYYEVYGNYDDVYNPQVGYYQVDSDGVVVKNTLIDTDGTNMRILTDGYAVKFNRPYSMLNNEDIIFTVNDVTIETDDIGKWFFKYTERESYDEFTDAFRLDTSSTEIESMFMFNNLTLRSAVIDTAFNEDTDVMRFDISNGRVDSNSVIYFNPLFAHAFYVADATDATSMTYTVRTAKHINHIGYSTLSESVSSNFVQAVDINLANYGNQISRESSGWSYSVVNPSIIYLNLKYNTPTYSSGSGLIDDGSVSAIAVAFAGNYNGDNHTISNLTKSSSSYDVALFESTASSAVIQNLNLNNFDITPKGNAIGATLVAENSGTVKNVAVANSSLLATFSTYNDGADINRPTNLGGVIAVNTGTVENATITNSTIVRHEVTSALRYGLRSYGVGGIIGSNGGTVRNSGVINTTITAEDNFIGGVVGISTNNSIIEDCYFIYNGVDASGNPIAPISYDTAVTLAGVNPRYSIGGIVGGIVYNETISTGNTVMNEGVVNNNLFLAVAPSAYYDASADAAATADTPYNIDPSDANAHNTSYPLVGIRSGGFDISNNIYLTGAYYSADNTNWIAANYNSLTAHAATSVQVILGLTSNNINRDWLDTYSNKQLANWVWVADSVYPMPPNAAQVATVPYTTDRPKQHTTFVGDGKVDNINIFSASLLFDDKASNFTSAGSSVPVTLEVTNTALAEVTLDYLVVALNFGEYSDYIDVSVFDAAATSRAVIQLLDSTNDVMYADIPYTYDALTNVLTVDTSVLSDYTLDSGASVKFAFDIIILDTFTKDVFVNIATNYYHFAMQANLGLRVGTSVNSAILTSGALYIQPETAINSVYNGGADIENTGTTLNFTVETTLTTSNISGYEQKGSLTQIIPNGFSIVEPLTLQVDGTAISDLINGTHYTITVNDNATPDTSDDTTVLKIFNLAPTANVTVNYALSYTGDDGTFEVISRYDSYVFMGLAPITANAFTSISTINIATPAPAPAPPIPFSADEETDESENTPTGGDGTGGETGDNTGDGTGGGTGDNTGDGTGDGTGDNTGDGTGDGTSDNTGDGTGDGTGDNTGDGTGD